MSVEPNVHSMTIALDGESKCGKTTFAEMIAEEARFQRGFYEGQEFGEDFVNAEKLRAQLTDWAASINFRHITTISAGNVFRAAAYYVMQREKSGEIIRSFGEGDVDKLREVLATEGVIDFLQNDDEVGRRVSPIAKLAGAQALCGAIFCDFVIEAYERDGGSNLVVVDARDPIGHMRRNGVLGDGPGLVLPASIVPVYIDTPIETAAARMKGDLQDNISLVQARRHDDATRAELPVVRPSELSVNATEWLDSLPHTRDGYIPAHFMAKNTAEISLENIRYLSGIIAAKTQLSAWQLQNQV